MLASVDGGATDLDGYVSLLSQREAAATGSHDAASCAAIWKPGTLAYRCRTCQANANSAICKECFQASHECLQVQHTITSGQNLATCRLATMHSMTTVCTLANLAGAVIVEMHQHGSLPDFVANIQDRSATCKSCKWGCWNSSWLVQPSHLHCFS